MIPWAAEIKFRPSQAEQGVRAVQPEKNEDVLQPPEQQENRRADQPIDTDAPPVHPRQVPGAPESEPDSESPGQQGGRVCGKPDAGRDPRHLQQVNGIQQRRDGQPPQQQGGNLPPGHKRRRGFLLRFRRQAFGAQHLQVRQVQRRGDVVELGDVGQTHAALPLGDRFVRHPKLFTELLLRQPLFAAFLRKEHTELFRIHSMTSCHMIPA